MVHETISERKSASAQKFDENTYFSWSAESQAVTLIRGKNWSASIQAEAGGISILTDETPR